MLLSVCSCDEEQPGKNKLFYLAEKLDVMGLSLKAVVV